jgi:adenine nucleotide transporter 17
MSDNAEKETTPQIDTPVTKVEITPNKVEISTAPETQAIPQNDNVAHALAGAGGGLLSMILT